MPHVKPTLDTNPTVERLQAHSRPRFVLVLLCLLGFLVQSHVAQTHFHHCAQATAAEACLLPAGDAAESRQPGGDTACALCQIAAHGGAAPLAAAALTVQVPQGTLLFPADRAPAGAVAAPSHSWQSRAPPNV